MMRSMQHHAERGPGLRRRCGLTLVELLVVVTILVVFMAVAVPRMMIGSEERRVREAARLVNTYLHSARNHAEETGRPVGVVIERDSNSRQSGIILRQVEVPPPYAGETTGAVVRVSSSDGNQVTITVRPTDFSPTLLKIGDRIRFGYQGRWFRITASTFPIVDGFINFADAGNKCDPDGFCNNRFLTANAETPGMLPDALKQGTVSVSFTILRQPEASTAPPLQMPAGTAVDLAFSGLAGSGSETAFRAVKYKVNDPPPNDTVTIDWAAVVMFSPNGTVESCSGPNISGTILEPIYLLIGRRDHVPLGLPTLESFGPLHEDGRYNHQTAESFWITVAPRTGRIMTEPVVPTKLDPAAGETPAQKQARESQEVVNSRSEAAKGLGIGGG